MGSNLQDFGNITNNCFVAEPVELAVAVYKPGGSWYYHSLWINIRRRIIKRVAETIPTIKSRAVVA